MPSRRPPSGDVSPAGSTIRVGKRSSVSPAEGPRPKKLKLTVRKPDDEGDDIENTPPRPKRKSGRPARYSDEIEQNLTNQPTKPQQKSPSPVMATKALEEPTALETHGDSEAADYSADFMSMYIDESPVPDSAPEIVKPAETTITAFTTATPVDTKGVAPTQPPVVATLPPVKTVHAISAVGHTTAAPPQVQDDTETLIKKLSIAVHALSGLNIPTPTIRRVSITPAPPAPKPISADPDVDMLLEAAGGDSPVPKPSLSTGTPDMDLKVMIQHGINVLRSGMVNKVQYQASLVKPRGRPKRDIGLSASIEADRFAMSALEDVARSSALTVNCVMSPQRANLTWHLCMSLLYIVTPPPSVPQQHQFSAMPYSMQNPAAIEAARAAAQAHQQFGNQGPPPPHQFLLRTQPSLESQNVPQNGSPNGTPGGAMNMDKVRMYQPGYLPRSGQSMKFSFQPPGMQFSPNGTALSMGPHHSMPPPGMAASLGPSMSPPAMSPAPHLMPSMRVPQLGGGGPASYPHPGAIVEDR